MLGQSHLVAEDEAADVASRRRQEAWVRVKLEMLPELVEPSERLVAEGAAVLLLLQLIVLLLQLLILLLIVLLILLLMLLLLLLL